MNTRIKLQKPVVPVPDTREEAEKVVREITVAKLEERSLKTKMDEEITSIRKRFEGRLANVEEIIRPRVEAIHAWATAHQNEFGHLKSLQMTHGFIGWRVTPPALKPIKGFTWASVLERLKDLSRYDFIRVKEEPNKEALLAARQVENLKHLYVQVVQEDEFFVEPKVTEVETTEKA